MGGTQSSKNVAKSIADVGTKLGNYIFVTQTTINEINRKFDLDRCYITGSVNFNNVGDIIASNRQAVNAVQSVSVSNDLCQIINQQAIAVVKPLKLDHKKSMQVTSRFASEAVNITKVIYDVAISGAYLSSDWKCERNFIIGDVNVGYNTIQDFWQNQAGNYKETEVIVTKILQDITQKTGKEISGISVSGIMTIIIIIISTTLISYPSGFISRHKPYFITFICLSISLLPIILYLTKVYPFYFKPSSCAPLSQVIISKDCDECKDVSTQSFELDNAPLRYLNNIFYDETDKDLPFGMLNMVVRYMCSADECKYNQGYNAQTWFNSGQSTDRNLWNADLSPPDGLPSLPNPLMVPKDCNKGGNYCKVPLQFDNIDNNEQEILTSLTPQIYSPDNTKHFDNSNAQNNVNLIDSDHIYVNDRLHTMAVLNVDAWSTYINDANIDDDDKRKRVSHARFILAKVFNYDTTIYIHDDEEVILAGGKYGIASDHKDKCYKFSNFLAPEKLDRRISSGGNVTGPIGTCVDREYKIGHAFAYINWILIIIIIIIIIAIIYFSIR